MDKIYRKISLEQAKNRTPNKLSYYAIDYDTNQCVFHENDNVVNSWGGYCVDLIIPVTSNECESDTTCIPDINWVTELHENFGMEKVEVEDGDECIKTAYWIRYKNMMMYYFWLVNEFIPSITFYQHCNGKYQQITVENPNGIFNDCEIPLFSSLNNAFGDYKLIGVTSLYDRFVELYINCENAQNFLGFIDRLSRDGLFSPLSGTTPYLDIAFSLNSNQTDMGLMSPLTNLWEPRKKYYLGEIVLYNNDTYILKKCNIGDYDEYEATGELLDTILSRRQDKYVIVDSLPRKELYQLSFKTDGEYNYIPTNKQYVLHKIIDDVDRYFLIYPYYKGEFNNITKVASFDTTPKKHWQLMKSPLKDDIQDNEEFTGITESKLIALKRAITSVDDFGESLPFIINNTAQTPEAMIYYMLGITNEHKNDDGTWYGDEMTRIRYKSNEEDIWLPIKHSGGITSNDFTDMNENPIYEGVIEFTYYIGCDLNVTFQPDTGETQMVVVKNRIPYTGVKYVEEWNFERKTMTTTVDGMERIYEYINLTPNIGNPSTYGNLDLSNKKPIYSIATYYGKQAKELSMIVAPYYKDESLMGTQDINTLQYDNQEKRYVNNINAWIERGTAASFERHNILGEIKTFSDLENYRNNFFEI